MEGFFYPTAMADSGAIASKGTAPRTSRECGGRSMIDPHKLVGLNNL